MSHFVVNLREPETEEEQQTDVGKNAAGTNVFKKPGVTDVSQKAEEKSVDKTPKKRGGCGRILGISAIVLAVIFLIGAAAGYFYWQGVKTSPQYSLALLVDAARRNDQKAIDELVIG